MAPGNQTMHGGIPVSLGGKPAILLFSTIDFVTTFSVVRFKYGLPTPVGG